MTPQEWCVVNGLQCDSDGRPLRPPDISEQDWRLAEVIAAFRAEIRDEIVRPLEARIKELESRPQLRHCGTWKESGMYSEASLCTHQGGLWLATKATHRKPGDNNSDWTLVVKRGQADEARFPTRACERSQNTS